MQFCSFVCILCVQQQYLGCGYHLFRLHVEHIRMFAICFTIYFFHRVFLVGHFPFPGFKLDHHPLAHILPNLYAYEHFSFDHYETNTLFSHSFCWNNAFSFLLLVCSLIISELWTFQCTETDFLFAYVHTMNSWVHLKRIHSKQEKKNYFSCFVFNRPQHPGHRHYFYFGVRCQY